MENQKEQDKSKCLTEIPQQCVAIHRNNKDINKSVDMIGWEW